tara:strand:+ start:371 stop:523 length:153 start_codon:yes stop_codon:yes gene_type:complete
MYNILKEFVIFLISRKKYYLIPILLLLFLFGAIIITGSGSPITPFIYAVF